MKQHIEYSNECVFFISWRCWSSMHMAGETKNRSQCCTSIECLAQHAMRNTFRTERDRRWRCTINGCQPGHREIKTHEMWKKNAHALFANLNANAPKVIMKCNIMHITCSASLCSRHLMQEIDCKRKEIWKTATKKSTTHNKIGDLSERRTRGKRRANTTTRQQ